MTVEVGPERASPPLVLSTAPFVKDATSTPAIMRELLLCLVPVVAAACWHFGLGALLVIGAATAGAMGVEHLANRSSGRRTLRDGSALLTGVILGLTLPPGMPLWMAFLGGLVAVGLGKLVWGGLGQNAFNPALVGRAFLQAAFPQAITTFPPPRSGSLLDLPPSLFAPPLLRPLPADVVSAATPLGLAKFEGHETGLLDLLLGHTGGSLGETCAVVLLACGVWLVVRRLCDWRLPVATLAGAAAVAGAAWLLRAGTPDPLFYLTSGGLLFGAVFMVTDPVTSPSTPRGAWAAGLLVGALVVVIRIWGGLAEGVMYAILLMNALTPLLERWTPPRPFGGRA